MGHVTALGATRGGGARAERRAAARAPAAGPSATHRRTAGRDDDDGARPASRALVGVVGGSRSDFPILEAAVAVLDELGVAARAAGRVGASDAGPPVPLRRGRPPGRGIRVIIAGAGGAAHLPGHARRQDALPVIGVPIPTQHLGGLDSLLSIVQMPRGIPVATVAIGNATNAGLLAAQILALGDPALAERLAAWRAAPDPDRARRPVERGR